jgi:serine/threonine protein kinase
LEFELNILKYLSSNEVSREHINPYLDYKIYGNNLYTIFPVFKGYSLGHFQNYMSKLPQKEDYYKIAFYLIKSLLHSLSKIHETGIAHQNINQSSILVSTFIEPRKIAIKFTDFGLGCGKTNSSIFKNVGNCRQYGHAPVQFTPNILKQLTDVDLLKVSQKYDVLCLGLLLLNILLYFDTDIIAMIMNAFKSSEINNSKVQRIRNLVNKKFITRNALPLGLDLNISKNQKKVLLEYLKVILNYMICPTIQRKQAQYITDKIIIYEKYKNDIF